jgi:putative hemolysin
MTGFVKLSQNPEVNISYADNRDPFLKRSAVRTIEYLTGGRKLARLYRQHQRSSNDNETFWDAAVRLLKLDIDLSGSLIPADGPLVVVANHPFGIVDGIVISQVISRIRPDFKIVAHGMLTKAPEAAAQILPIDFGLGREALATTIETRKKALEWLHDGHVLVIFPAGGVSTATKLFSPIIDARWRPFTAKLIHSARAPVLPIFFYGSNSLLFQIASQISYTLRLALFVNEVHNKMGDRIGVRVGKLQPYETFAHIRDRQALVDKLYLDTYGLGGLRISIDDIPAPMTSDFTR